MSADRRPSPAKALPGAKRPSGSYCYPPSRDIDLKVLWFTLEPPRLLAFACMTADGYPYPCWIVRDRQHPWQVQLADAGGALYRQWYVENVHQGAILDGVTELVGVHVIKRVLPVLEDLPPSADRDAMIAEMQSLLLGAFEMKRRLEKLGGSR
jgi:hypothetical protein